MMRYWSVQVTIVGLSLIIAPHQLWRMGKRLRAMDQLSALTHSQSIEGRQLRRQATV
jgi:hypothetical protein